MNLRILHTADNHIGISFNQYPEVRERLVEERFEALERLVATGNEREAHFFVVAGDLFDKQSVTKGQVERAVKILAGFGGEAVLVLAGNHDFCEGADNKLGSGFGRRRRGPRCWHSRRRGHGSLRGTITRCGSMPAPVRASTGRNT